MMDDSTRQEPLDLEHEIEQTLQRTPPRMPRTPMPGIPGAAAEDVGRLSAEAVMAQYEAAAKAVEEMGVSVRDTITKLEQAMAVCDADMKLLGEAAAAIRKRGKAVMAQIAEASAMSNDIRAAAAEFTRKMGA